MCCFFNSFRRQRNCCDFSSWERCCNRFGNRNSSGWSEDGCRQSSAYNDALSANWNQSDCCCRQTARCCQ